MTANRVRLLLLASAGFALVPGIVAPRAQTASVPQARDFTPPSVRDFGTDVPAHLSFVDGQVTLERDGKLEPAEPNLALLAGDRIHTRGGRVEILYADGSTLDVDQETEIDLLADSLVRLLDGTLRVNIPRTTADLDYRVDAPAGSIEIRNAGEYRVDTGVDQHGEADVAVTVVRGSADLANELGRTIVRAGRQAVTTAKEAPSEAYAVNLANWDEFDQWSDDRRVTRVATASSAYLPEAVDPYSSVLDDYGTWSTEPLYGAVWYPRVAADWHPYSQGRWSFSGYYGWLWVGIDHWSWPTHHFGRWGYNDNRWFWIPGQTWSPAWVAWGYAPGYVSWCPLGFDNHSVIGWTAIGTQTVSAFRVFDPLSAWTVMPANQFAPNVWVTEHVVARNALPTTARDAFVERPAAPMGPKLATPRETVTPLRAPTRPQNTTTAHTRGAVAGPFEAARVPSRGSSAPPRDPIRSTIIGTPAETPTAVDRRLDHSGRATPSQPDVPVSRSARPTVQAGQDAPASRGVMPQIDVPRAEPNRTTPARAIPRPSSDDPVTYSAPSRATDAAPRALPHQTAPDRTVAPGSEPVPHRGNAVERTPPAAAPPAAAPASRERGGEMPATRTPLTPPASSAPPATATPPARGAGSSGRSAGGGDATPPSQTQAVPRGGRGGGGGA